MIVNDYEYTMYLKYLDRSMSNVPENTDDTTDKEDRDRIDNKAKFEFPLFTTPFFSLNVCTWAGVEYYTVVLNCIATSK
jgi:hypothetical protein